MDTEEANKFINSLVKKLQVLCHGHVNFNNSVQVIGHLYLNVDSNTNIDYIVNEKVCRNDNSSTVFVSNSYHSEPIKKKPEQESTKVTSSGEISVPATKPVIEKETQPHNSWLANKPRKDLDRQLLFHSQPVNIPQKTLSQVTVKNQFSDNKPSQTLSYHPPSYTCNDDKQNNPEKTVFQVFPELDMDLSSVKTEPVSLEDIEINEQTYEDNRTTESSQYQDFQRGEKLDELMSEDFLIGLKGKMNKNITPGIHQGASSVPIQMLSHRVPNISSSTELFHEPGTSSNKSSFYQFKSNSPDKLEDKVPYSCKICDKSFRFQTSLRRHIREKHLNIRFVCPQCGMTFTQKVSLFNHVENRCRGAITPTRPKYKPTDVEHHSQQSDVQPSQENSQLLQEQSPEKPI